MARKRPTTQPDPATHKPAAPATDIAAQDPGRGPVVLLATMLLLTPALGVPHEEMLQDTLKSMLVAFFTLGAALLLFWQLRQRHTPLRWHVVLWFPLALMVYAFGSMAWSHTFLAGVEAIRWFIFSLLLWLVLNAVTRQNLALLAAGAHAGAVLAAFWGLLQFWLDFGFFPQGPNPASTFVNRNFVAEYVVCVLPLSAWLLMRARSTAMLAVCAFTLAFNMVLILATGARAALLAMWLLLPCFVVLAMVCRQHTAWPNWTQAQRWLVAVLLLGSVAALGAIPTGNTKIIAEHESLGRGLTALERGVARTASMAEAREYTERSFSVRWVMWQATARMVADRPLTGVGAGAWEVAVPLYQADGAQLETDFYVHNEFLQLLAEYGLTGALALLGLLGYLAQSGWRTWRHRPPAGVPEADPALANEGLLRGTVLLGLLALMVASGAGFPWRLAGTGALFALYLGVLAASDARLGLQGWAGAQTMRWQPAFSRVALMLTVMALALTAIISQQAAQAERKIVQAIKLALTVSQSGEPNHPRWINTHWALLRSLKEGVAINPHYRKLTPIVADELASWGDWKNAVWIWESVAASRPNVVVLLTNIARGHAQMGDWPTAYTWLQRSIAIQPNAPSVRSMEVVLLGQMGQVAEAAALVRRSFNEGRYDLDMVNAGRVLGLRLKDWDLAIQADRLLITLRPAEQVAAWLRLGQLYATEKRDDAQALNAFRSALAATPDAGKAETRRQIPAAYQDRLN